MKLELDPNQPHQLDAIESVIDVFGGQPYVGLERAACRIGTLSAVANRVDLGSDAVLGNVRQVQERNGLPISERLHTIEQDIETMEGPSRAQFGNFSVEMETGTGKTYAYLRTALELARHYGLRKFIVVVPSIAIREGVLKTLRITSEHFRALYPDVPYRYLAYDSRRLTEVRGFADARTLAILVVTIDAFNKATNILRQPNDRLQGATGLQLLQATHPVIVLDEPQNLESELSVQSLAELDPVFALRFGATHRRLYDRIHRLTPREAHERHLVKRIQIAAVIESAEVAGEAAHSAQIRRTIEEHFERQAKVANRGIKVLSLFFVDRVASYTDPDGLARTLFDRHFDELKHAYPGWSDRSASSVRAAYFAERRRRGGAREPVDTRSGRTAEDEAAFQLIMRDKERLLSFDEPVSFVFSHSALREGWDNPNVFQICVLARSRSETKKRQEIGRGMRLPVDQRGRRVQDAAFDADNVLTVVANESYDSFVTGLLSELEDVGAAQMAPVPRRAGETAVEVDRRPGPERPTRAAVWVDLDRERLVREALVVIDELEVPTTVPRYRGPLPNLVALVDESLARRGLRITRRTILELLRRAQRPERMVAHPFRFASWVASAVSGRIAAQKGVLPQGE